MKKDSLSRDERGFTLIELLTVIAIIGVLASLAMPAFQGALLRADTMKCFGNLRQMGIAVNLYLQDHDGTFPYVEPNPKKPIYPSDLEAKGMLETFQNYGVSDKLLQCPSDMKDPNANYYAQRGTSYEWRPFIDGSTMSNLEIYRARGMRRVSPSATRLVMDVANVHYGHQNYLYADGHVVMAKP